MFYKYPERNENVVNVEMKTQ